MHKKLASELNSLAHDILKMRNKDDVFALKEKAEEVYEKLSVLVYIENYINTTPQAKQTKEELIESFKKAEEYKQEISESKAKTTEVVKTIVETTSENKEPLENITLKVVEQTSVENTEIDDVFNKPIPEKIEQPFDELEQIIFDEPTPKEEVEVIEQKKIPTLEEELQDTLPVDVMADLFTKVESKKSINDKFQGIIKVGLNDRIAFVNHLFNGNQSDFNRVISQLNTAETLKEAKDFIKRMVKPEYDWTDKEEYETRFIEIIERKFI